MAAFVGASNTIPWWKEPNRDHWNAFIAAWMGWSLDAFDFTVFLLIMHPIAQFFGVSMLEVTFVFTITLWMRLLGATASCWIGDRIGRKTPLMVAILGYSLCNLAAGLAPTFTFLFVARAILGLFMGAEWPAGSALAMETWPQRSRGLMGGILQGSWGIGFLMSFAVYGLFYDSIGWRGMLMVGVLPALAVFYVRFFVKEPEVWVENRRRQKAENREVKAPLFMIFKRGMIGNTLTACWWMASGFVTYYSVTVLFATHLQVDLKMTPGAIGEVGVAANLVTFLSSVAWGWVADKYGRRASMIIPALIAIPLAPMYLLSSNLALIWWGFVLQGAAGSGGMQGQMATYLNEQFPTEVRATASGFCYHQGAIWGALSRQSSLTSPPSGDLAMRFR
jgi:SHS family lactate transporter-like MFS transporter